MLKALADDFLQARHDRVVHSSGHGHTMATEQVSLLESNCYTTLHLGKGGSRKNVDTLARFVYGGITN